ncbi:hypothetical protein GOV13_04310 [Candidatus Pacearchaeota archaeon]|nr:hypothetical protein [Candidatus Pacearchaeota archaeon]
MKERGQVTIFIIIALVIVGVVLLFFVARGNLSTNDIPASFEPAYNNLQSCFEEVSNEGAYAITLQGGYYNVPTDSSVVYFTEEVPYYYLDSKNYVPELETIEEELGDYISKNLDDCLDLEDFDKQGFEIDKGKSRISTKINERNIEIKIVSPITIRKGEDSIELKDIKLELDYDIKNLYLASKEIVEDYSKKPGVVCLTCLEKLSQENNVAIEAIPMEEIIEGDKNVLWFLITNKEDTSEDKLTWRFVVEQ